MVGREGVGPSYQLAVVVDDAAMGVTEVIRGDDLVPSTPRQILLFRALGWPVPTFGHVPLVLGPDGRRLAKRDNAIKLYESYAERTGTSPQFTYKGMRGGGDVFVVEGTIDYGDGIPVSYVGIGQLRDGKVAKMTEYFANPFPAPEWRAAFVQKM